MTRSLLVLGGLALFAAGCVGTDLVDEMLPPTQEPRIAVTPSTTAVIQGATVDFQATYYDEEGEAVPEVTFSWSSSDPGRASVETDGRVTAHGQGQVMIRAAALGVQSTPALLTIVADPNQVARVVVMPDSVVLEESGTQAFAATAFNIEEGVLDNVSFTWQSSDTEIATIDAEGRATALQPGTVDITATADDIASQPARLTVRGAQRTGTFRANAGTSYNVTGTAVLEEQPGGRLRLSFGDNFMSSNGPGLEVFLSAQDGVTATSFRAGPLQQTSGAQDYDLPSTIGLDDYRWVIIHCVPFNVTFGSAELQ